MFVDIILGVVCGIPIGKVLHRLKKGVAGIVLMTILLAACSVALYEFSSEGGVMTGLFPLWTAFAALVAFHGGEYWTWRKYALIVASVLAIGSFYVFLDYCKENGWIRVNGALVPLSLGYVIGGAMSFCQGRNTLRIVAMGGLIMLFVVLDWTLRFEIVPSVIGIVISLFSFAGWSWATRRANCKEAIKVIFIISAMAVIFFVKGLHD